MEWLSAENVVAVGTAVIGVVSSAVMVWYERRVPRRKRVGYRVQMDNPIGDGVRSGRANVRLGLFDETPGMSDATLVLLRIENDGSRSIGAEDYTSRERHGLTAVFTDRTIRGVSVTQPPGTDHLMDHFTPAAGIGYENGTLRIPRVPLFSRAARLITVLLTVCVVTLAAIVVLREDTPPPIGCERGTLAVTGSTAFEPVARELAEKYEHDCRGATITVDAHGSTAGVRELDAAGRASAKGSPALVALSDGPKPGDLPHLRENRIAVSVFTLVVNDAVPVRNLSLTDVRRLYRGEITNWKQLGGPDRPVLLVSRDANSGTRQVFQRRVLGRGEIANSSLDCVHKDDTTTPVVRCELDSTEQVLDTVARLPGAIGYSELNGATGHEGLHRVSLDGHAASVEDLEHGTSDYPYREIEYAYTYGQPPADSLASSFLSYIGRGSGQDVVRTHGHLPCGTPVGLRICGAG
ncbi:substrate-binding domain-containing protein [Streptomyces sp. NPDC001914]|uniref:substrate-binding domain-containing protein n=1 Tax=Streptomyces sp. NPDC001914 TaxID=3364623 RepID=UPI0036C8B489